MIDETALLAAVLHKRQAYEQCKNFGLEPQTLSDAGATVFQSLAQQYERDRKLESGDRSTLRAQIIRRYGDGSMSDSVLDFVESFPEDSSAVNVVEEYRLLRLGKISTELATCLATGKHGESTDELLQAYGQLRAGASEGEQISYRLSLQDFKEQGGKRIPIMPVCLNNYIGGGVLRGHNITVYGRPDSGKSMFALCSAAALCMHGYRVLYVANEEPAQDITRRLLCRMADAKIQSLHSIKEIQRALDHVGDSYNNWHLFHKAGVTAADIARQASIVKPDMIVVDQLKNVAISEDNRALQLDKLARQVRELGIAHNCVTMSVTQAGESGSGKLVLGMTDVEWSNTGIPGAADLMIGIGVNEEWDNQGKRMISLPKNKINGRHGSFPVWVDPQLTAFMSKRRV
jgi:KaiC/GvpD/RAD55 family RecA-like ATPase